ncbi:hypothetical protein B566_EDAN009762 [Ephemera danica]|nr:hypothetical protein B566_EDAN009762 [Ephemera danica]
MDEYDDDYSDVAEYSEDDESYEEDSTQGESEISDSESEYADGEEGSSKPAEGPDDEHLEQNDHSSDDEVENLEVDEYSDNDLETDGDDERGPDGSAGCSEQRGQSDDTAEYLEDDAEYTDSETDCSDVDEGDYLEDTEYSDDDEYLEDDVEPMPSKTSSSKAAVPKNKRMPKAKPSRSETFKLIPLSPWDEDYSYVSEKMHKSIVKHSTMTFTKYKITKIEKVWNSKVYSRFKQHVQHIREETDDMPNVTMLFHGSPKSHEIVKRGFDERHASKEGMYGAVIQYNLG